MKLFTAAFLLLLRTTECSEVVRAGAEVTLVCGEVQLPQTQCNKTTWVKAEKTAVELFKLGRPNPEVSSDLSSRLSLTEDCGLKIQDVQTEDGADYHCQQYESKDGPLTSSVPVPLTVVSLTEEEVQQGSKLQCEVFGSVIDVRVRWLYTGGVVEAGNPGLIITSLRDRSILIVQKDHFLYKEGHLFKCEVIKGGKSHNFSFTKEAPGDSKTEEREDEEDRSEDPGSVWLWPLVSVVSLLLLVVVVLLVVCRAKTRAPAQEVREDLHQETEPEDGVSYAEVHYRNQRPQLRHSEDAVTYSSVKIKTREDQLYATVNKPNESR
ncbi:unnamed protein product [Knipowitschia caucasica]